MSRVEDITEVLWGSKVSLATIGELNKKTYVHIEGRRNRPLQGGRYPYIYVDGIYLRCNWVNFFQRFRGFDGVKLMIGDKCLGILEAMGEVFPEAKYQRCTVHFYRNVFSAVPVSRRN